MVSKKHPRKKGNMDNFIALSGQDTNLKNREIELKNQTEACAAEILILVKKTNSRSFKFGGQLFKRLLSNAASAHPVRIDQLIRGTQL